MAKKRIFLTDSDYQKLSRLIGNLKKTHRLKAQHLIKLAEELDNVLVFDKEVIPQKYVTLYSKVTYINLKTGKEYDVTIVFPVDIDENENKYSIFSPIGTALIGEEKDSIATCYAPGGEFQVKILDVQKSEKRSIETIADKATV